MRFLSEERALDDVGWDAADVRALVFVASFILDPGECPGVLAAWFRGG